MNEALYAKARRNMVDSQILPNRVTDERVIAAMETMPRELFVANAKKSLAYMDESIPLEDGRYLMQPMVTGRLLDVLNVSPTDVALAIGCGTGYAVALLARLADTVVAVESDSSMRQKAERVFAELSIDNVAVVDGTMADGYPQEAPYDVVFVDGAVPEVPEAIISQLSDGGRLVAVEMRPGEPVGRGVLVNKFGDAIAKRDVFDASEPVLPGFEKEAAFTF